jgi:hypothetical protein
MISETGTTGTTGTSKKHYIQKQGVKMQIRPGSTIIGKSGKELVVDEIDGDLLICGDRKIRIEAVVRVIPPPAVVTIPTRSKAFKLGDRVQYIGTHPSFQKQYGGVLTIWELGKGCDLDKCACQTPDGRVSTWIEYSALQLVEGDLWA